MRSEYVEILRKEIGDPSRLDYAKLEKLPLLDSFIKETVRVNPLDTRKSPKKVPSYPCSVAQRSLQLPYGGKL